MKILFYSVKDFERCYLDSSAGMAFDKRITDQSLSLHTAGMAEGFTIISVFTSDDVSVPVIEYLYALGVRYITTRAAGYDNIDIDKAAELGITVANVPDYSPYAIVEHALALMLALDRKLILANKQTQVQNFTVRNLIGFDLHGKTVGIIGTGRIGSILAKILHGFGCRLLGYDINQNNELVNNYGLEYVPLAQLCREAAIISIHTALTPQTKHIIDGKLICQMRKGVMIINTSRGACVNTGDVLQYLENGHIGYFGTDVYEHEKGVFLYDWSEKELADDTLKQLMHFQNVLVTPHQAFATEEALTNIARTTCYNISCWMHHTHSKNELYPEKNNEPRDMVDSSSFTNLFQ